MFDVSGRGYVNAFRSVGLRPNTEPMRWCTSLAGHDIDLMPGRVRNEPFYNLGGFAPLGRQSISWRARGESVAWLERRRSWVAASRVDFTPSGRVATSWACHSGMTRGITTCAEIRGGTGSVFYAKPRPTIALRLSYGYADSRLLEPQGGSHFSRTRPTGAWRSSTVRRHAGFWSPSAVAGFGPSRGPAHP